MFNFTFKLLYPLMISLLIAALLAGLVWPMQVIAAQTDLIGPPGSGWFGQTVTVLPNGNIVVTDLGYDADGVTNVGAVYLYNGATSALISQLIGGIAGDQVGSGGVTVLPDGNYVVRSPLWDNGAATEAGAVTWGSRTMGAAGAISAANSLVGSTSDDQVGYDDVIVLPNGNYMVISLYWDNGTVANAGAVTWGSGTTGVASAISAANSLVGSTSDDQVGYFVSVLPNGNYVVRSPYWHNGAAEIAGAVTWGSGTTGITGIVSAANSLVGSTAGDQVGWDGVTALPNGNYIVRSPWWDNSAEADTGAVTWGNGITGIAGTISAANSLVGNTTSDRVGSGGVTALANGNYVVRSPHWRNSAPADVGAVTWGNGTTGITGTVSAANSLVGSTSGDGVGYYDVMALPDGNYVVRNPDWDNGATANAGAVTWGSGTMGITGIVSVTNSLVGSTAWDSVGSHDLTVLSNGNYVVSSPDWNNGAVSYAGAVTWGSGTMGVVGAVSAANSLVGSTYWDSVGSHDLTVLSNGNYIVRSPWWHNGATANAGAVTWGSGTMGITGIVSAANSLVGSTTDDRVGEYDVTVLPNGNYVVRSGSWDNGTAENAGAATWGSGTTGVAGAISSANSLVGSTTNDGVGGVTVLSNGNYIVCNFWWDNGAAADAGAVTWGSGTTGITGTISAANSLVGSTAGDQVGWGGVTVLPNGNYVVRSPDWNNGSVWRAGAVTWGSGTTGIADTVSAANSLVGSTTEDWVGWGGVTVLPNGNYVVHSPYWRNGVASDAGVVTWGSGTGGISGPITADNSVRGVAAYGGDKMNYAYDSVNQQLIVGRPADNIVTLFTANTPPIANAGPDQSDVLPGAAVTLDGSASIDPGGYTPLCRMQ